MGRFSARLTIILIALFQFSALVSAGTLDDYYLQQFGEAKSLQLQKAVLSVSSTQAQAQCGMPLKHSLKRDWNLLEQSTQKVLAKQLALPVITDEAIITSSGGHFKIHYSASGTGAPDIASIMLYTPGLVLNSTADWASIVASTFEYVYSQYSALGYQPAPTTSGVYDVYLNDQASKGYYGVTNSGQHVSAGYLNAYSSWMELDSSFTNSMFRDAFGGPFTPLQSLQVTAAHEYHHAVQYGYSIYFDIWYAEATSTWMEDELYDDVNQSYNYITAWFTNSTKALDLAVDSFATSTGAGYSRWIFNRYLSEQHGPAMIRSAWEKVGGLTSSTGADIPMAPVLDSVLSSASYSSSLSNDFFGFSKRAYVRNWTTHTSETAKIHPFLPRATYSSTAVDINSSPAPTITLPHYSFVYHKFVHTAGAPNDLPITITGTSGIKATAFRKNGATIDEFPFTRVDGATITVPSFNTSTEVVLLISNVTNIDNHSANFSTNGTGLPVTEPSGETVYPPQFGSSGNSGCFIATAAYGSYLHPHVQQLRTFRDEYLLTNAPGRTFVALYYRSSPPLADFIARHPLLRGITRLALTPLVAVVIHPLLSAAALLLGGAGLIVRFRRIAASHAYADIHRTSSTSSRI